MALAPVYAKTAQGVVTLDSGSTRLSTDLLDVLALVDGKSNLSELAARSGRLSESVLETALEMLAQERLVRLVPREPQMPAAAPMPDVLPTPEQRPVSANKSISAHDVDAQNQDRSRKTDFLANAIKEVQRELKRARQGGPAASAPASASVPARTSLKTKREALDSGAPSGDLTAGNKRAASGAVGAAANARSKTEAQAKASAQAIAENERKLKALAESKTQELARRAAAAEILAMNERAARLKAEAATAAKENERAHLAEEVAARDNAARQARAISEQQARLRAEAETKAQLAREARARLEHQAQLKQQAHAKTKAEQDARLRAEAELKAQAAASERLAAEKRSQETAQAKAAAEAAQVRAEAEEKTRSEQEAHRRAAEVIRERAESAAKARADEEVRRLVQEEARLRAAAEERAETERLGRLHAEAQAKIERDELKRLLLEAEAKQSAAARAQAEAQQEARLATEVALQTRLEEAARRSAEDTAHLSAAAEARAYAEQTARRTAEAEAKAREEVEARLKGESSARADAEARANKEAEARHRAEAEASAQAEQLIRLAADNEAMQRRAQQATAKAEGEARLRVEAETRAKAGEEARRRAEEAQERAELKTAIQVRRTAETVSTFLAEDGRSLASGAPPDDEPRRGAKNKSKKNTVHREAAADTAAPSDVDVHAKAGVHPPARALARDVRSSNSGRGRALPRKWGKTLAVALVLSIAAGVGFLLIVPLKPLQEGAERMLTERLGEAASVADARVLLFPTPALKLTNVTVGTAITLGTAPSLHIDAMTVVPEIVELLGGRAVFKVVELDGLTFGPGAYARVARWLQAAPRIPSYEVRRVAVPGFKMAQNPLGLQTLTAQLELTPSGRMRKASFASPKGELRAEVEALDSFYKLTFIATRWSLPAMPALNLDELTVSGVLNENEFNIESIIGRTYAGVIEGAGLLQWRERWKFAGTFNVTGIELERLSAGRGIGQGRLDVSAAYAMLADTSEALPRSVKLRGKFSVLDGELSGIDITRVLDAAPRTTFGGATPFKELSGSFQFDDKGYHLSQLKLSAGALAVNGHANLSAAEKLTGDLHARLTINQRSVQDTLHLGGTLAEPRIRVVR